MSELESPKLTAGELRKRGTTKQRVSKKSTGGVGAFVEGINYHLAAKFVCERHVVRLHHAGRVGGRLRTENSRKGLAGERERRVVDAADLQANRN